MKPFVRSFVVLSAMSAATACASTSSSSTSSTTIGVGATTTPAGGARAACATDLVGVTLPQGFCATVFADSLGPARHMAVAPNGDVFVAIGNRGQTRGGGVALRDSDRRRASPPAFATLSRSRGTLLAPEYGGDKNTQGRCANVTPPIGAYPGHWAPNDLMFYTGTQFPEKYRGGAFIAFHGSWNRDPEPQAGYHVVFNRMVNGRPTKDFEVFADEFAGATKQPRGSVYRPTGLAQGADGSLCISDDVKGRIWRVMYVGAGTR